jgi:hypothetical protein
VVVRNSTSQASAQGAFVPTQFQEDIDVASCALDEQLEQLHRQYAAASRASSGASFELKMLESRDDIHPHVRAQARLQRTAADTRAARLMRAIDALEARLENE